MDKIPEYKILTATRDSIQQALNSWRHDYEIKIEAAVMWDNLLTVILLRIPK